MAHTTSRFAAALALTIALAGCATTGSVPLRPARRAGSRTTTARSPNTPPRSRSTRTIARPSWRSSAPSCGPRRITTRARGGSKRPASSMRRWSSYQIAAELNPGKRRHRRRPAQRPHAASDKVVVSREGKTQLETLIDQSQNLRTGRAGSARRRAAAGLSRLPRRQRARRLHGHRPLREPQHRLRSARSATSASRSI